MTKFCRTRSLAISVTFLMMSVLLTPLFSRPVMAQATTGALKGVVTDSGGAVIADADVTAKNDATGVETRTKSNGEGLYNFPGLQQGVYTVSVQKQGYKKQEFQQVTVSIGQAATIDAALQAGNISETVTVTASGEELIQKEQVQQSSSFEARKVADLPSNIAGGGIDTLALLAPGVVPGVGNVNGNGTTFSVNGQRARSNNFTIDGGDNNDLSIGGPNYFVDNQDIVAEFQVITNNFSAEYGRNQGAIVNIVTKSGTNAFHGTAFEYHRNANYLSSLDNIEKRGGLTGPPFDIYNVFGGTVGGPVKKDRIFFFGSFQEIKERQSTLAQASNPAIAPEDLPKLETLPGFATNPALQALRKLSAFAVPNAGGGSLTFRTDKATNGTVTIGGVPFHVLYPQRAFPSALNAPEFSARGDWKVNDKNSIWFRQLYQKADNLNGLQSTASAGNIGNVPVNSKISSASWTSQISNSAVNEFRFIYNRLAVIFGGGCEGQFATCIPDPVANMGQTLPLIAFTGIKSSADGAALQSIGPATNLPQGRVVTVYQFQDNFSKTLGKHQFKMGVDVRKLTNSVPFLPNVNGSFTFNTISGSPSLSAGNALVQNRPQRAIVAAGQLTIDYGEIDQFYYFQDDWRIKDNLTLNLGIRYEYTGQPINTLNDISVARENDPAKALWKQSLPIEARTEPKLPADKNNWAPRLGFAWRPKFGGGMGKMLFGEQDKTVISGGYSIAYDPVFYNIMLNISTSSPMVFNSTTLNPISGAVAFPVPGLNGAAVQSFASSSGIVARNTFNPKFFNQTMVAPNFHSPYSEQWSLRVQREISRNNVLEVRYVGTHGVSLFATHNANPRIDRLVKGFTLGGVSFPGFPGLVPTGVVPQVAGTGGCVDDPATPAAILNEANTCNGRVLPQALVRIRDNTAQSIYHSLQTRYEGRIAGQLNFGLAYTFSKALDNASEVFAFNDAIGSENPFNTNSNERSYSQFDRRHAFAANWIWDVPLFKNQNNLLGKIAGGWQINGTYLLATGQRFTPFQFINSALGSGYGDATWDATFIGADSNRPFFGNPKAPRDSVGINQVDAAFFFGVDVQNPNGFYDVGQLNLTGNLVTVTKDQVRYIVNGPGAAKVFGNPYGTVPRNFETGPLLNNVNLGIFKNFRIKERLTLRLSLDAFNAFNHPNPGAGINSAPSPTPDSFVEDGGTTFNKYSEMEFARRSVQLGVKILF